MKFGLELFLLIKDIFNINLKFYRNIFIFIELFGISICLVFFVINSIILYNNYKKFKNSNFDNYQSYYKSIGIGKTIINLVNVFFIYGSVIVCVMRLVNILYLFIFPEKNVIYEIHCLFY